MTKTATAPRTTGGAPEVMTEERIAALGERIAGVVTGLEQATADLIIREGAIATPEANAKEVVALRAEVAELKASLATGAVIRARCVEIVDEEGNVRVVLGDVDRGAIPKYSPGVAIFDEDGHRGAFFTVESENGPGLYLDRDGWIVASVTTSAEFGGRFEAILPKGGMTGLDGQGLFSGYDAGQPIREEG